jgi:redox-sensitive bicupin YhaK (pirin superfamily)
MKTRLTISAVLGLMAIAASGCWYKKSSQQQYTEALMRGNSMQASQVWLNMSQEDRMKFARGEGIKPDDSSGKDEQQIMNHYRDEMGEEGPSTAEEMEQQMSTPLGSSLRQLPGVSGTSSPSN